MARLSGSESARGPESNVPVPPRYLQPKGKFRFRSTPCALPSVSAARPSGLRIGTIQRSVPAGGCQALERLGDRDAGRLVPVDTADDEHRAATRRADLVRVDRPPVDGVADYAHDRPARDGRGG